jgi:flagellar basal-body rod protein FlgF
LRLAWRLQIGVFGEGPERIPAVDNTQLITLSQQMAASRAMDVIANNLANASTPAFKRESMKFEEYMANVRPAEGENSPQTLSFVQDTGILRNIDQGPITATNAPFDVAINGTGYFVVQTANGNKYTRNGHFTLDNSGTLVNDEGDAVLGDGGPVTITPDDGDIHIAADGTISGKTGQLAKLQVVTFANERALEKQGASLYATGQPPQTADKFALVQGSLEGSNVEPVIEISHMLEVMRAYQTTAGLAKAHEDLMQAAVDKLGSMPS